MEQNDITQFDTQFELSEFIGQRFKEGECLENGMESSSVMKEVAKIAAVVEKIAPHFGNNVAVDITMPFVAALRIKSVIKDAKNVFPEIHKAFQSVLEIFGEEIGMKDFGEEGEIDDDVIKVLVECLLFDDMNQLIYNFNTAAESAIKSTPNIRNAAIMLAASMIKIMDSRLSLYFVSALKWCSYNVLSEFDMMPLYLLAFNEIVSLTLYEIK